MNREELRGVLLEELARLAREADLAALSPNALLREELDIDSFDFGRFVTALDARLKIAVPEEGYQRLQALEGCVKSRADWQPELKEALRVPRADGPYSSPMVARFSKALAELFRCREHAPHPWPATTVG